MRKTFVVTLLLILSLAFCFADSGDQGTQSVTHLDVTAVKSGSLASDYALVVTATVPEAIVSQGQSMIGEMGTVESFDITSAINSTSNKSTIDNALALKVETNSKRPVLVDVWFSAFRDTSRYKGDEQTTFDGLPTYYLPVKWTAKSIDPAFKAADETYQNEDYQYMLKLKINDKQMVTKNDQVALTSNNEAGQTMHLVYTPIAQGGSVDDPGIPESVALTLPGMDTDLRPLTLIERTVNFTLNLPSNNEFNLIPTNTNYTCTVRVSVLGE
jgi:hypothetical protein